MNQNSSNPASVAFKPWPTIGYGLAAYVGSTILGVWLLTFLSMVFMSEAVDVAAIAEGDITPEIAHYFLQLVCISAVIGSAIVYYFTRTRLKADTDTYLGIVPVKWSDMRPWLWLSLGFVFIGLLITYVYEMIADPTTNANPLNMLDFSVLLIVTIVIAVPMWEELLFRGFIFAGLENSPMGTNGAILLSAIWWAGMHMNYNIGGLLVILCFGIVLGLARARYNSILLPIVMHSVYNGAVMILGNFVD